MNTQVNSRCSVCSFITKMIVCLFVVGCLTYLLGLYSMINSSNQWKNEHSPQSEHNSGSIFYALKIVASLPNFSMTLVWDLLTSVSGGLYMTMHNEPVSEYYSVFYALYAFIISILFKIYGDAHLQSSKDVFATMYPVSAVSSNQTVSTDRKFIVASMGALAKGLGWLLFIVVAIVFTFRSKTAPNHQSWGTGGFTQRVARVIVIASAAYCSVMSWSLLILNLDIKHKYVIFGCYLPSSMFSVAMLIVGFVPRYNKRVIKAILVSMFCISFITVLLIDLVRTIYQCEAKWSHWCIELNPVYYSTMISINIVNTLLWMNIFEFWPLSHDFESTKEKYHPEALNHKEMPEDVYIA